MKHTSLFAALAASALAGAALSWALFLAVEVKDGFYYKFSPGDLVFNSAGAALAAALALAPQLDRLFDFRVQYWPSAEYLGLWRGEYNGPKKGNSLNVAEDYSGQTYVLALHLGAIPRPRATPDVVATALDYLDIGVGFATRRYKPDAPAGAIPSQHLTVGVTLDLQHVLARVLGGRPSRAARRARAFGDTVFEYLSPPFALVPVVTLDRTAAGPAPPQ